MNPSTEPDPYQKPLAPPPLPQMPPPLWVQPYGWQQPPTTTADDRTMAMLCHLLSIFTGFLGPLILWLVKKDSSPFVDHHGREALNFQITVFLATFCLGSVVVALMFLVVGFFLFPLLLVVSIGAFVLEILACIAANRGEWHRYPFCLRMV